MACTLVNDKPGSPRSPPSPWVSLLFVFTCHRPLPSLLCSCADRMADTLMGPVLSNGAGLEFDTLTPPISAARHQEPHRMLSGKMSLLLIGISLTSPGFELQKNTIRVWTSWCRLKIWPHRLDHPHYFFLYFLEVTHLHGQDSEQWLDEKYFGPFCFPRNETLSFKIIRAECEKV